MGSQRVGHDWATELNWTELLYSPALTTICDQFKGHSLEYMDFFSRVMSLLFNMLSRFVLTFLTRGDHLLISWLQSPSAVISEPKKMMKFHYFYLFPFHLPCKNGARWHYLSFFFLIFTFKLALSLSSFILIKSLFISSSFFAIRVVSYAYLRSLMFLPRILIPACNSSSPTFLIMCSVYRLNNQGDSRQPCCTPFLILNQSVVPYMVLTIESWPIYRFLRR